ncbi:MAG: response regulator [Verrucomicrobiota bacterium]
MKRILLIDDEPDFTALLKDSLQGAGDEYSITMVNASCHAAMKAREFEPHLIFLDVVMPGQDGGDLASEFAADPELSKTPIVMLTALVEENPDSPTGETVRGGLTFVSKTSSLEKLKACIEKHAL